jgi:hypothetical protein
MSQDSGVCQIQQEQAELFAQHYWICTMCEEHNRITRVACNSCGVARQQSDQVEACAAEESQGHDKIDEVSGVVFQEKSGAPLSTTGATEEQRWTCQHCDEQNRNTRSQCNNCGQARLRLEAAENGEHRGDGEMSQDCSKDNGPFTDAEVLLQGNCTMTSGKSDVVEEQSWICRHCDEPNRMTRIECNNCGKPRTRREAAEDMKCDDSKVSSVCSDCDKPITGLDMPSQETKCSKTDVVKEQLWICRRCDEHNRHMRTACNNCGQERAAQTTAEEDVTCNDGAMSPGCHTCDRSITGLDAPLQDIALVILHIYDVSVDERVQAVNEAFRAIGAMSGAFHAGVEVLGREWSFGYSLRDSGVTFCDPKCNPNHRYREAIPMGTISLTSKEVLDIISELSEQWPGNHYDLLTRNCCHFADKLCGRFGLGPIPDWVTHLAGAATTLVNRVSAARDAMHDVVGAAAETAADIEERYKIFQAVDSIANREIDIDESYIESKVQNLWAQTVESIENVGILANRAIDEVQKPLSVDVEQVEAQIFSAFTQLRDMVPPSWPPFLRKAAVPVNVVAEPSNVAHVHV